MCISFSPFRDTLDFDPSKIVKNCMITIKQLAATLDWKYKITSLLLLIPDDEQQQEENEQKQQQQKNHH